MCDAIESDFPPFLFPGEVVAVDAAVTVPAGTFSNCIKLKEMAAGESPEYKYFAKGVGLVREQPTTGDVLLISHKPR